MVTEASQTPIDEAVRLEDILYRIRNRTILDGINLHVDRGTVTGILGPNGAGKTTLLNIIVGLIAPVAGRVIVLGHPLLRRDSELSRQIGVVLQETALYDELNTIENLRFAASLYGVPNPGTRIDELLRLFDLTDRAKDRVGILSGGLRRRIVIARALIHAPRLLVIDEPTLGVDGEARHSIWSHLRVLRSIGTTIVVSTNYLDEAIALCDTVSVLRAGRLIVSDTPQSLVERAGSCLELDCGSASVKPLEAALIGAYGVLRTLPTPTGLSVFLQGGASPEFVVLTALKTTTIVGFRIRGADLVEVFQSLEPMP